jgi:hypothetical protein
MAALMVVITGLVPVIHAFYGARCQGGGVS